MTIHSEHPFHDAPENRDPARRFRGRLGGAVTLVTAGEGSGRAGLTVSSLMVAHGDPAHVLALVDPDSTLAETLTTTRRGVVQLLSWDHHNLADAFAGLSPAPGGLFTLGSWRQTAWGPVLEGVSAWLGFTLAADLAEVGWSALLDGVVEEVHLGDPEEPLVHRRGRYRRPGERT